MTHTNADLAKLQQDFTKLLPKLDLEAKQQQLSKLEQKTLAPDFWLNESQAKHTTQKISHLQADIDQIQTVQSGIDTLSELADQIDTDTKLVKELAAETQKLKHQFDSLKISTCLNGPYDQANAYLTIFSGQGGTEAMDWAQMLLRMYLKFFEKKDWSYQLIEESAGEEAGIKSATVQVSGKFAYGYLKAESGTHRLVRLSPFNADNLRQTSFAGVEVLPEITQSQSNIKIDPSQLEWQFFRSGGKGGQNVNKVSTAVRLKHLPTGIVVTSQTQRHQEQNRKTALSLLEAKLWQQTQAKLEAKAQAIKGDHQQAAWGNQIRSYVLHPYQMIKDHRTDYQTSQTQAILDGDLEAFIQAFLVSHPDSSPKE